MLGRIVIVDYFYKLAISLLLQMQTMQNALESREAQFTARMNDFERLQKTAIEYSAAINVPDAPMPTIPKVPAVSRQRTTTPISQESGDLVPLTVKPHDTKSPIPCSEAELESSTEDSSVPLIYPMVVSLHPGVDPADFLLARRTKPVNNYQLRLALQ